LPWIIPMSNLNPLIMSKTATPTPAPVAKKRFVIAKSMLGKGIIISFTNHKGEECTYDHDKVYEANKSRFEVMPCFAKYGNYTNSNNLPKFVRDMASML
jgi:hypothetical protein